MGPKKKKNYFGGGKASHAPHPVFNAGEGGGRINPKTGFRLRKKRDANGFKHNGDLVKGIRRKKKGGGEVKLLENGENEKGRRSRSHAPQEKNKEKKKIGKKRGRVGGKPRKTQKPEWFPRWG